MHPADLWWKSTVEKSFTEGWIANTVFKNRNSRRYITLLKFRNRWRSNKIIVCNLPEEFVIFAPSEAVAGQVSQRRLDPRIFCYLSPQIEYDSQKDADFYAVHEFAHLELNHFLFPVAERDAEIDADALAAHWGFPKRKRGRPIFQRLVKRPLQDTVSKMLKGNGNDEFL